MSRNIDIVIKQFKELATDNQNEQHYWENRPNPNAGTLEYAQKACESAEYHEYIVACLEELKTRREADRWNVIRTEEDLPKESDWYLVTRIFNGRKYVATVFFNENTKSFYEDSCTPLNNITHWRPLPKAPESEAENDG